MIKQLLMLLGAFCPVLSVTAAVYSGAVFNSKTSEPVAYANVGIPGRNIGTVTDEEGKFSLDIGQSLTDTIVVSMIGYHSFKMPVRLIPSMHRIQLVPSVTELSGITVKPHRFRHRRLGNMTSSRTVQIGFTKNELGNEIGTLMKVKRSPTIIDSVCFNIAECTYDSIFFRVNVYERDGEVMTNILREPIYIRLSRAQAKERISINLTSKSLVVNHNFIVALEMIKDLGPGRLYFCAGLMGAPTYMKSVSFGDWTKMGFGTGISAFVTD